MAENTEVGTGEEGTLFDTFSREDSRSLVPLMSVFGGGALTWRSRPTRLDDMAGYWWFGAKSVRESNRSEGTAGGAGEQSAEAETDTEKETSSCASVPFETRSKFRGSESGRSLWSESAGQLDVRSPASLRWWSSSSELVDLMRDASSFSFSSGERGPGPNRFRSRRMRLIELIEGMLRSLHTPSSINLKYHNSPKVFNNVVNIWRRWTILQ